jgi:hypothetical protein
MTVPSVADESGLAEAEEHQFSVYYADLLAGSYECIDRLVLNAYFQLGQTPGGFRTWWRQLHGSDADLDTHHLMRMAGRFSRRVRAYAQAHHIPLIDCQRGERKHELAQQYLPTEPDFTGVFAILVGRAPAPVWEVRRNQAGQISELRRKQPYPYVNHYAFHIMDRNWGHLIIKLCPHPPFGAQIILNGHEYVAQQATQAGIEFTKEGNCFTHISDPEGLARIADTLRSENVVGQLRQVCEQWIYSTCLCFALTLEEQARTDFQYRYSTYQMEYSYNFLFQRGGQMEHLVQGLIDRVRASLEVKSLKTIFGAKRRPFRHTGHPAPRLEVVVERPTYHLTILKLHFDKLTVKLYTKGERVLRMEVTVHNTKALPYGRRLAQFPKITHHLKAIGERFLTVLHCVERAFISADTLDQVHTASQVGQTRVGGINLHQPRMRAVIEAVIQLAPTPDGFTVTDMADKVREIRNLQAEAYTTRQAAYDLKKLRGKHWVHKRPHSRRYEVCPTGVRTMTALWVLREKVIKPVLAGVTKPKRGPKPKHQTPLDAHYHAIQLAMFNLFQLLGISV